MKNLIFMRLFILRHGKSIEPTVNQSDIDRGLSKKGFKQIEKIGHYLTNFNVEAILSSSAKRTKLTTEGVNKYLKVKDVFYSENLYLADVNTIHKNIVDLNSKKDLLFVGHNFGISQLVTFYTGESILLSTGMLAIVKFDFDSSEYFTEGTGRLIELVSPKKI